MKGKHLLYIFGLILLISSWFLEGTLNTKYSLGGAIFLCTFIIVDKIDELEKKLKK